MSFLRNFAAETLRLHVFRRHIKTIMSEELNQPTIEDKRPRLWLVAPGREFVRPYFERLMPEYRLTDSPDDADATVMISSTDIYDVTEGCLYNELTSVDRSSAWSAAETGFANAAVTRGLAAPILRAADIIATGMTGLPRKMAEQIYRGIYVGVSGNEAERSFIHAVDLPGAARIAISHPDIYNVCGRSATRINDLADALAWRIAQKRVFDIKPRWYKWIFGRKKLDEMCRTLTFSSEKICSTGDFNPIDVVQYLKTHKYDDDSL